MLAQAFSAFETLRVQASAGFQPIRPCVYDFID